MATNERWLVCGGRNMTIGDVTDILDALESIADCQCYDATREAE